MKGVAIGHPFHKNWLQRCQWLNLGTHRDFLANQVPAGSAMFSRKHSLKRCRWWHLEAIQRFAPLQTNRVPAAIAHPSRKHWLQRCRWLTLVTHQDFPTNTKCLLPLLPFLASTHWSVGSLVRNGILEHLAFCADARRKTDSRHFAHRSQTLMATLSVNHRLWRKASKLQPLIFSVQDHQGKLLF